MSIFKNSILAGIMIAIGGSIFLCCDNKYIGAVLFSVALLCICYMEYSLYTGKIGFLFENFTTNNVLDLLIMLNMNFATALLTGMGLSLIMPISFKQKALDMCANKLSQGSLETLIKGFMCGILMYLAVAIYKKYKNVLGIIFCIPTFILSGYEHSIADSFYFGVAGTSRGFLKFIVLVVLGNTLGSLFLGVLDYKKDLTKSKENAIIQVQNK